MRLPIIMLSMLMAAGMTQIKAQDNMELHLKDGSVLKGYISSQRPGIDFSFTSSEALINLPDSMVMSVYDREVPYGELSEAWREWAEKNEALRGAGDNRTLTLSTVSTHTGGVRDVRVLEKGVRLTYLEMSPNTRQLPWDAVDVITVEPRSRLMLSGIDRKYKLFGGAEVKGQYVEEHPGETISLLSDNGLKQSVNVSDIERDSRYGVNPAQDLFGQSDLMDIVQLKGGASYSGIIFERSYDEKDPDKDFLVLMMPGGATQSISMKDVLEYRKTPNPDYDPLVDIKLAADEGAVNRVTGKFRDAKVSDNFIQLSVDSIPIRLKPTGAVTNISVEVKGNEVDATQWRLVRINRVKEKKDKDYRYGFTFEQLVTNPLNPLKVTASVNNIVKFDYKLTGVGVYGFYNPTTRKILLFTLSNEPAAPKSDNKAAKPRS